MCQRVAGISKQFGPAPQPVQITHRQASLDPLPVEAALDDKLIAELIEPALVILSQQNGSIGQNSTHFTLTFDSAVWARPGQLQPGGLWLYEPLAPIQPGMKPALRGLDFMLLRIQRTG